MQKSELLQTLATYIADYREGEIEPRTPDVIESWLCQFPSHMHVQLLIAMIHVFSKAYLSREKFYDFLATLASTNKLSPEHSPSEAWRRVNFLNIQGGGNSQGEVLSMFDDVLRDLHGFGLCDTGATDGHFVYLDDCIGTGNRVRIDVCNWLEGDSPMQVQLHIVTPIYYTGAWWIDSRIQDVAKANSKTVSLRKWSLEGFRMENRKRYRSQSDVLWPISIPNERSVHDYAELLNARGHPAVTRAPQIGGTSGVFADETSRQLLEEAFLVRGCQIRQENPNLPTNMRPLGYSNLDSFGFGSMFLTFRNCPNNCPLALWVEQSEYPALFPRKTNVPTTEDDVLWELLSDD